MQVVTQGGDAVGADVDDPGNGDAGGCDTGNVGGSDMDDREVTRMVTWVAVTWMTGMEATRVAVTWVAVTWTKELARQGRRADGERVGGVQKGGRVGRRACGREMAREGRQRSPPSLPPRLADGPILAASPQRGRRVSMRDDRQTGECACPPIVPHAHMHAGRCVVVVGLVVLCGRWPVRSRHAAILLQPACDVCLTSRDMLHAGGVSGRDRDDIE